MKKFNLLLFSLFILFLISTIHLYYESNKAVDSLVYNLIIVNIVLGLLFNLCLLISTIKKNNKILFIFSFFILLVFITNTIIHIAYLNNLLGYTSVVPYLAYGIIIYPINLFIVLIYYIINLINKNEVLALN